MFFSNQNVCQNQGTSGFLFPSHHLRLCYINSVAQIHTLHKALIHYHVPFNKEIKHSSCQTISIYCACFLETTQKYRVTATTKNITSLLSFKLFLFLSCSHPLHADSVRPTLYGIPMVFMTESLPLSTYVRLQAM